MMLCEKNSQKDVIVKNYYFVKKKMSFSQMNNFDDVVHSCIISFLTTREYVLTLSISKNIQGKSLKQKKFRMPYITAYTYDPDLHNIVKCHLYHFTEECKTQTNWPKHDHIHSHPVVISTLLKFGDNCMIDQDTLVVMDVVPWKFRNYIQFHRLKTDNDELKLDKYNNNQNPKLSRKYKELKNYLKLGDVYMEECEEYLEKRMEKKNRNF
jgi:hypothetical protein